MLAIRISPVKPLAVLELDALPFLLRGGSLPRSSSAQSCPLTAFEEERLLSRRLLSARCPGLRAVLVLWAVVAWGSVVGCRGVERRQWPFPKVEAHDDASVLAVFTRRGQLPRALYAELQMSFDSKAEAGVFDVVVVHESSGRLRMKAFRDGAFYSRDIFDLVLAGDRFEMILWKDEGPHKSTGSLDELSAVHPGFVTFALLRERFFLPGSLGELAEERVVRTKDGLSIESSGRSGVRVTWRLDPVTLGVQGADVRAAGTGRPSRIEFLSYREVEGRFLPERFELHDPDAGVLIEGRLKELELDFEIRDEDFELTPVESAGRVSPSWWPA